MRDDEPVPVQPEIDAHLQSLSDRMRDLDIQGFEADLAVLRLQRVVLDALVMEGVDDGFLADYMCKHPDNTMQKTIDVYAGTIELLQVFDTKQEAADPITQQAIAELSRQRKLAVGIGRVTEALVWVQNGVDPQDVREEYGGQFENLRSFTPDEQQLWVRILDRVIAETPSA